MICMTGQIYSHKEGCTIVAIQDYEYDGQHGAKKSIYEISGDRIRNPIRSVEGINSRGPDGNV
jgi:hypothetical protein